MNRPLALATPILALALLALAAASLAAGDTVEEKFNKRVGKFAFPLPVVNLDTVSDALRKGKALCVCREDSPSSADNRAGVVVRLEEAGKSPLTRCLVATAFVGGDPLVIRQCEDWVPLRK